MSWTGLHGNMTFNQTLHYLYKHQMDDVEFKHWRPSQQKNNSQPDDGLKENITTRFTLANNFCKVLEIVPGNNNYNIDTTLKGNVSFSIFLYDPVNSNNFLFPQLTGDKILHDNKEGLKLMVFKITLKETEDKTGGDRCIEYPNKRYQSFSQCLQTDVVSKTRPVFGFTLPFFTTTDKARKPIQRQKKHEPTVRWLQKIAHNSFGGILYQPAACPPPCTTLTATSEQQQKFSYKSRAVSIFINDIVEVQTTVLSYDMGSLLVEVGSSLGLWLGLSVVGLFDLLTTLSEILLKKI